MPFSDYKTALVTGASTGMGAAIVERFCREGLEVHALARNAGRLNELAERTGCIAHAIDVCDLDAVTALTKKVPFDIVVNNAGVSRKGSILNAEVEDIDVQVEVNLQAVLHLVRLTMPGMVERDRGHIVNISSIAAIYNFGGNSIYHATKAGIHALSRQLRVDATGKRVRVTEICPGRVATDIFGHVHGDIEAARKEFIDGFELPRPEDIADAIAFAIAAPLAVNISNMEILPTLQVPGGLTTVKREPAGSNE
ncbi:SDR family oxidoreductase [Paraburkholderia tropica]|uniref:SDR family oxidoreductase n=1 Tax=Paraburkholderia tropica TaxID=92647 RepID=UPI002AB73F4A|nr:SDR family oxidoreductase [Paraburkholderia tropica]